MSEKERLEQKLNHAMVVKWKYVHEGNPERVRACREIIKTLRKRIKYLTEHTKEQVLFT